MQISQLVCVDSARLAGSQPSLESYDQVSKDWEETEYRVDFNHADVEGGLWSGSKGSVSFESWPYTELCVMLSGRVRVEADDGSSAEFGAGECFMIPQGFRGTWITLEATRKVFVGVTGRRA
jgi:uncharacterized cupin superfamily protein